MKNRVGIFPFKIKEDLDLFKVRFFKVFLYVVLVLMGLEMMRSLLTSTLKELIWVHVGVIVATFITLILLNTYKKYVLGSIFYGVFWLVVFTIYWLLTFGVDGANSYLFFALLVASALIQPQWFYNWYAFVLCALCLLLSAYFTHGLFIPEHASEEVRNFSQAFYYLLHSLVIGVIMVLLKFRFEGERRAYQRAHRKLGLINEELVKKRSELRDQKNEVSMKKENLEKNVSLRTSELNKRNQELSKHAYNNAHIIRSPLSNIQGILSLLTSNKDLCTEKKKQLNELLSKVDKLDAVVRKVNRILT